MLIVDNFFPVLSTYHCLTYQGSKTGLIDEKVKEQFALFLEKNGVRADLKIVLEQEPVFAAAGSNISYFGGKAEILMPEGFQEADPAAFSFLLKHQISHIRSNNNISNQWAHKIPTIVAFNVCLPAQLIAETVSGKIFAQWRESAADDFAICNSSISELKGGISFFSAARAHNLKLRESRFFGKFLFSPNGESRMDWDHPSIKSRLAKIQRALEERDSKDSGFVLLDSEEKDSEKNFEFVDSEESFEFIASEEHFELLPEDGLQVSYKDQDSEKWEVLDFQEEDPEGEYKKQFAIQKILERKA